ncbi:hypothetical protein Tco_0931892 [Tanacetum coccineum]
MNRSWKPDLCNDSTVASEPKVRLKRRKEEVGCVEDKQRMDAVKEKAIEAIMRYCDSLYFKENTIEEKLNGIQGPRVAYAMGFPKEYVSELEECYGTHLSLLGAYYEGARNYSSGMDVPKAREREGTSGIMAMELPSEETRQGHIRTKARLVDDEEGMIGKVELDDGENATNKKIKKEDELKTLPSITLRG